MEYTEAKKNADPIRDDEFKKFIEQDFSGKLEEELLSTEIGKRVKMLEGLGLNISVKGLVGKYISQEGYTMDNVGNLYLQEQAMQRIYVAEEAAISESLNIDISKITDLVFLQKVISNVEHKRNVEKYGVEAAMDIQRTTWGRREELKEFYDFQKDYAFLFKPTSFQETKSFYAQFDSFYTSRVLIDRLASNPNFKMSKEQIEKIVQEHEKMTVDSNIENKETVKVLRALYSLRSAVMHKELNGDKITQEEIQAALKEIRGASGKAQYVEFFTDKNGNINIENAIEFLNSWEDARNDAKILDDMSAFSKIDFKDLNRETIPKILTLIQRAQMGDKEENKTLAITFAENLRELGIDLFSEGVLDVDKIAKFYEEITDGADIYFEIEQTEWNEFTFSDKLDRVDDAIDYDLGTNSKSRDQINSAKESMNKLLQEKKLDKKFAIERIIKDGNYSPEQVVALFYEFRYKEIAKSGKKIEQFDGRQLRNTKEHGTAEAIMTYMLERPEQFKEYIKSPSTLNGKMINEFISRNEFSNEERSGISNAFYMIEKTMTAIEEKRERDTDKVNDLINRIESYRGILGTEISTKDKNKLFKDAKKLYATNSLSKAVLRDLVRIDKDRVKQMHREVVEETNGNRNFGLLKAMSDIGKNLKKTMSKERKKQKTNGNRGLLKGKVDTMAQKISKITGKKENEKKEPQSNLPVVKRKSIFDAIKSAFLPKDKKVNSENVSKNNEGNHASSLDKEKQNQAFVSESLTGSEKSDTTVIQTDDMDYLKVGFTPRYKQDASKSEQGNQNGTGELNPEEQEIRE